MRFSSGLLVCLATFFAASLALTLTSPSSGSKIDPTQPLTISWSVNYTDPSVIDLKLSNPDSSKDVTIATGVVSYTGTYTVPGGTLRGSGSGYTIVAVGNSGTLDQVSNVSMGAKGADDAQTSTVAEVTLTSTQVVMPTSAGATTSGGTVAASDTVPMASIDSVGVTTMSGTVSGSQIVASITHTGSSFVTSTMSRAGSGPIPATATAGSTNTASGQRRLGSELALGAAGVLAGMVALLA